MQSQAPGVSSQARTQVDEASTDMPVTTNDDLSMRTNAHAHDDRTSERPKVRRLDEGPQAPRRVCSLAAERPESCVHLNMVARSKSLIYDLLWMRSGMTLEPAYLHLHREQRPREADDQLLDHKQMCTQT